MNTSYASYPHLGCCPRPSRRRRRRSPSSVLPLAPLPVVEVVPVAHAHLLALVSHEADGAADIRSHGALEAALAKKAVDRLDLIPTWRHEKKHKTFKTTGLGSSCYSILRRTHNYMVMGSNPGSFLLSSKLQVSCSRKAFFLPSNFVRLRRRPCRQTRHCKNRYLQPLFPLFCLLVFPF